MGPFQIGLAAPLEVLIAHEILSNGIRDGVEVIRKMTIFVFFDIDKHVFCCFRHVFCGPDLLDPHFKPNHDFGHFMVQNVFLAVFDEKPCFSDHPALYNMGHFQKRHFVEHG